MGEQALWSHPFSLAKEMQQYRDAAWSADWNDAHLYLWNGYCSERECALLHAVPRVQLRQVQP